MQSYVDTHIQKERVINRGGGVSTSSCGPALALCLTHLPEDGCNQTLRWEIKGPVPASPLLRPILDGYEPSCQQNEGHPWVIDGEKWNIPWGGEKSSWRIRVWGGCEQWRVEWFNVNITSTVLEKHHVQCLFRVQDAYLTICGSGSMMVYVVQWTTKN